MLRSLHENIHVTSVFVIHDQDELLELAMWQNRSGGKKQLSDLLTWSPHD